MGDDDSQSEDRKIILERRKRFVLSAISGLSLAIASSSCGDSEPQPCLDMAIPGGGGQGGGGGGEGGAGGMPQPCLGVALGGGGSGGEGGAGGAD